VTTSGERYRGAGIPFEPSLGNNVATIETDDTLTGMVSFEVPRRASITSIRYLPAGSSAGPLIWAISL
jgi:hypothetical protein